MSPDSNGPGKDTGNGKAGGNGNQGAQHGRLGVLEFPCRFPIKAMGRQRDDFEDVVLSIVLRHAELWPGEPVRATPSKAGRFVSITAVVDAQSQAQLDAIYRDLTDCEQVLVAL